MAKQFYKTLRQYRFPLMNSSAKVGGPPGPYREEASAGSLLQDRFGIADTKIGDVFYRDM